MNSPEERIAALERRVAELERTLPRTALVSRSFIKRAFAVWGHYFVAHLMILAPFIVLYVLLMLILLAVSLVE